MSVYQTCLIFIVGFLFCSGQYYAMESVLVYKKLDKYFYFVITAFAASAYIFSQFILSFPISDGLIMIVHRCKLISLIIALYAWVCTYYCEFFKESKVPLFFLIVSAATICTVPFPIFLKPEFTHLTVHKFNMVFTYNFARPGISYSIYSAAIFLVFVVITFPKIVMSKLSVKQKIISLISFLPGFVCFNDFLVSHKIIENIMLAEFAVSLYVLSIYLIFLKENIHNHQLLKKTLAQTKEYNEHLEQMVTDRTRDIELKEQQKTNFFINLAHETKNPLTLIQNYIESYIKEKGVDQKLEIIRKNIHKLTRDMVNFLDVEKLDRGMFDYNDDKVISLSNFLENTALLFSEQAEAKQVKLTTDIEKGLFVKADPGAMERIFNNLLDNALKFTPEDGKVMIRAFKKDSKLHVLVKDTGPGIPAELQESVFLPYYLMNTEKQNCQGIGMGLCIVKKIVGALGGSVTIEDTEEKGSCFHVVLEMSPEVSAEEEEGKSTAAPVTAGTIKVQSGREQTARSACGNITRSTILFIEDNPDLRNFFEISFENSYQVQTAENGLEALEKLESLEKVDIIVSDVMMDGMGGFEFLEKMAENPFLRTIPVIFLTARSNSEDRVKGYKLGAVDFIAKPFSFAELSTRIESHLKNSKRQVENVKNDLVKYLQSGANARPVKKSMTNELERQCREYGLSKKELEIVKLIFQNNEYKEIAYELKISINTVNYHLKNIFQKIEVRSKSELIMKFMATA